MPYIAHKQRFMAFVIIALYYNYLYINILIIQLYSLGLWDRVLSFQFYSYDFDVNLLTI